MISENAWSRFVGEIMTHTSSRVCSDKVDDVGWCVDVSNKAIAWVMATSMGQKKTKKDVERQM